MNILGTAVHDRDFDVGQRQTGMLAITRPANQVALCLSQAATAPRLDSLVRRHEEALGWPSPARARSKLVIPRSSLRLDVSKQRSSRIPWRGFSHARALCPFEICCMPRNMRPKTWTDRAWRCSMKCRLSQWRAAMTITGAMVP